MNRVLISLLKGATKNKILLYNMDFSKEEMIEIINSGELKKVYNLSKGSNFSRLQEILDFLNKEKIATVIITDDIYPESLKEIFDPPFLLYVRGNVDALKGNLVSIVGTRKPSLKGLYGAYELGLDFGRYNIGVVSGLALGIDSTSQNGNNVTGGKGVAVLGTAIDVLYPKENRSLAGDIIKNDGAIISEYPPGSTTRRFNFPKRNRIIAGLTQKLIIVQAPKKSGSLITGDFALEGGSDIFIHSSGIGDKRFLGSDRYFKDGARKIDKAFPIIKSFGFKIEIADLSIDGLGSSELLKLELAGKVIKFKGRYFVK